jgi:hypothetical protein
MATSAAQYKASKKWADANYKRVSIAMAPADYDTIKSAAAASPDGSLNKYIINAVLDRVRRESGALTPAPQNPAPAPSPSAEQPAPKSTEQPKRNTPEELLEQQKKKLAEQTEEIKRREAEKAEAEARKEAERQQREKEAQEFLRQFVEQFNREQARLAGEGKPFKEWRDLYDQDQSDILHAASFRDYREVSTLQELTPRERKARGFPLFDEKPKNF